MSKKRKELAHADLPPSKKQAHDKTHTNGHNITQPQNNLNDIQDSMGKVEKKKKKKDKDKQLHHDEDTETNEQSTSSDQRLEDTQESIKKKKKKKDKDMETNEQWTSLDQPLEDTHEGEKKKKKKKDKKRIHEKEVDAHPHKEAPQQTRGSDHAPADIGAVDIDILQQASVNLGLPLADDASESVTASQENSKKKKKKERQSKTLKELEGAQNGDKSPENFALNYLRLWHSDRKAWKFNKRLQTRLIRNIYISDKVRMNTLSNCLLWVHWAGGGEPL